MSLEPLTASDVVFRLIDARHMIFDQPGEPSRPSRDAFEPSGREKSQTPILVSVWDRALIAVDVAARRMTRPADRKPCFIPVALLAELRAELKWPELNAVRDPRPGDEGTPAGAHCGLAGLDRPPGMARHAYHSRLELLLKRLVVS